MYYEWKVVNSSEIALVKFPYMTKTIMLENYYNQEYRIWETANSISLYQTGKQNFILFKDQVGQTILFGTNDYLRLELEDNGTYTVYHGQVA